MCTAVEILLLCVSTILLLPLTLLPLLSTVVPMFHCNGWMFPWSLTAQAGCSHLQRQVRAESIFDTIEK